MIKRFVTRANQENIYLYVNEEAKEAILVDPGEVMAQVDLFIEEQGLKVVGILLTHSHGDHIMGVPYYRDKYQVPLYAHMDEKELMEDASKNLSRFFDGKGVELYDVHYLQDAEVFSLGKTPIKCIHTPGHTKGSCLYLTDQGIFCGDTIFRLGMGRFDLYSGDLEQLQHSLQHVIYKMEDDTLYPGHGPETTVFFEKKNNPHFREI